MKKTISSSLENLVIRKRDFYYVQETLNGSSRAFSKLTGFYYKRIFAIGMRFFHNQADAEECVRLYFFNGMSHEEISKATGIPVNTIKSHIFRAKKILGKKLEDYR